MSEQIAYLPQEGERIGSGIVISLVNAGGSARVYKTWVEDLELARAVKVMNPDADQETRDRFATEARITSKLTHPNIVQAFNYGKTAAGLPYIEMELISGLNLQNVLRQRGALPLPVALAVAVGVLEALHYAHTLSYTLYDQPQRGIMHRDIKPGNIIFSGGIAKLMDFGIARPVTVSLHTIDGGVPGTAPYVAPEACMGGECDFRSDIYQVGLLMYECISGAMAFPQTVIGPLLDAIKTGNCKPLNTYGKATAIIKKCMAIDPEKRYQTAQECLADVKALYHTQNPQTTPEENILAFLQGTVPVKISEASHPITFKGLKTAAVIIGIMLVMSLLVVLGVSYVPEIVRSIQETQSTLPSALVENTTTTEQAVTLPATSAATAAPRTPRPAPAPATAPRPNAPATPTAPPPDDAITHIAQGKNLLAQNKVQEALASFQTALRTPSASMPRQEIIRQSTYGVAQSNTILFRQNQVPRTNYEAAWRSVQNVFPLGSREHTEAQNHLGANE
jgi:serine/threonine-protein kinase